MSSKSDEQQSGHSTGSKTVIGRT